jgi:hypothetical protein
MKCISTQITRIILIFTDKKYKWNCYNIDYQYNKISAYLLNPCYPCALKTVH